MRQRCLICSFGSKVFSLRLSSEVQSVILGGGGQEGEKKVFFGGSDEKGKSFGFCSMCN